MTFQGACFVPKADSLTCLAKTLPGRAGFWPLCTAVPVTCGEAHTWTATAYKELFRNPLSVSVNTEVQDQSDVHGR